MKPNNYTKKGFTLTELAIVIAVIAILIAVLVPTFVSLINKANESSDEQTVKNLNTALQLDEAENDQPEYLCQVWAVLKEYGYNPAPTPDYSDNEFYWYKTDNRILIYSKSEEQFTFPSEYEGTEITADTSSVNLASKKVAATTLSKANLLLLDTYTYSTDAHDTKFTDGDNCAYCGRSIADDPQHEHTYTAGWSWEDDYSAATVTLTCSECKVSRFETATITSEIIEAATCEKEGEIKYTATVTYDGNTYTDTKTDTIAMTEHTYSSETVDYITTDTGSTLVYINGTKKTCEVCGYVDLSGGTEQSEMGYEYYESSLTEKYTYSGTTLVKYVVDDEEYGKDDIKIEIPYGTTAIDDGEYNEKEGGVISGVFWCDNDYISGYITSVTLPSTLKKIGVCAFYGQNKLSSITIPASVAEIGDYAFAISGGDGGLNTVTFEEGSQLTTIGSYAFNYCNSLTSIELPSSVKVLGEGAFSSCMGLISITLNEGLEEIGGSAFYKCKITSIVIPDSVTSIGNYAFDQCTKLESLTIGESVNYIGWCAFNKDTSLTSVIFKVTSNWYVTESDDGSGAAIISDDLSNTSTAATCLTSTYNSYGRYWYISE